ncbi:hypothetical protein HZA98_01805 [Candidatus Woesearchaeota archaeon]|nr:hypothetical protein [Candidatus Woesearchaeota archaeon]
MPWSKKGEAPISVTTGVILAVIFLVVVLAIFLVAKTSFLNTEQIQQTNCWASNSIKCNGGLFHAMPNLCDFNTVDNVDTAKLAQIIRDAWWMYKQGSCDFGTAVSEFYPVYAFTPKEDINLQDFFQTIMSTNRGVEADLTHSDYNYLEQNTAQQSLCFDTNDAGIKEYKLSKGKLYYILYYDDQQIQTGTKDKVLISSNPDFNVDYYGNILNKTEGAASRSSILRRGIALISAIFTEQSNDGGCITYGFAQPAQ